MLRVYRIITIFAILFSLLFPIFPKFAYAEKVIKVTDGDTIILEDNTRVRLIGLDCPELHHPRKPVQYFAKEAYQYTKENLEGKEISLEYEKNRYDRFGRTLAYIILEDGRFFNAELIRQGYCRAYTKFKFSHKDYFVSLEKEARKEKLGLWA